MTGANTDLTSLACEPLETIRIGFIGLGNRGRANLQRYTVIDGITIVAICDLDSVNLDEADRMLHDSVPARQYTGPDGWERLCEADDVDLVFINTDWLSHARIAKKALLCGKHVAVEVPIAMTVEESREVVETAEKARRHCFMLENCCFDPFALNTLNMHRMGLFGKISQCEGAYIHDLRALFGNGSDWMARLSASHGGNPYPTHGLGPICQLLGINRDDSLDYLVSMSAGNDGERSLHINNTLIRTTNGASILLQYDVATPRPYSRIQSVSGSKGFVRKYPIACLMFDGDEPLYGEHAEAAMKKYEHPYVSEFAPEARRLNQPNLMNYIMDRRLVYCLRNGLPLDINVYDAAQWSCIAELSALSANHGSVPVKIPSFRHHDAV